MTRRDGLLADLLHSFFHQRLVRMRQVSPATMSVYRDALRLFIAFSAARHQKQPCQLHVEDLGREQVLEFLDHLELQRENSIRTRNARLTAIRSFFRHVADSDPSLMQVAQRVLHIPRKLSATPMLGYLTAEELAVVLEAPDRASAVGRRDYALLLFLSRTGARVSEAIAVNCVDLRLERPHQVQLFGKGGKPRAVPLGADTAAIIGALIEERGLRGHDPQPVFVNNQGKRLTRLTRFGVTHVVARAVAKAAKVRPGLAQKHVSPHTFRHTAAMLLLQSGVDLNMIRAWLGHAHLDTTHQYVEADMEMKRRSLAKADLSEATLVSYVPPDPVLAILESISGLCVRQESDHPPQPV